MGASIYTHAIIGLKVSWDQVCTGTKKVKAFKHNHPEDWEHDPKTGQKLWYEQDTFIDGWEGEEYGSEKLGGYGVVSEPPSYEGSPEYVFICLAFTDGGDPLEGDPPQRAKLPTAREEATFKQKMADLGLLDEDNLDDYGLWAWGYATA